MPTLYSLAPRVSENRDETRSFGFFRSVIGPEIFQAFNLTVVDQLILQLSHSDDTVKHAVVALGSLAEYLFGKESPRQGSPDSHKRLQFAQTQNVKAINRLRVQLANGNKQSIELTLISCFLFVIFDFLLGDDVSSRAHLSAGLKILQGFYSAETKGANPGTSAKQVAMIRDFARIFSDMDLHAVIWLGLSSFQSAPLVDLSHNIVPLETPIDVFETLHDARESLDYQIMRIYNFHHSLAAFDMQSFMLGLPFHVQAKREALLYDLRAWHPALDELLKNFEPTTEDTRTIALMRMNYYSTFIDLATSLQMCPFQRYRDFTPIFKKILALARSILHPVSAQNRIALIQTITIANAGTPFETLPMFAFVSGAIRPLYMVADKCFDFKVSEEAIDLLEEKPWREGAWDSAAMAAIARKNLVERTHMRSLKERGLLKPPFEA